MDREPKARQSKTSGTSHGSNSGYAQKSNGTRNKSSKVEASSSVSFVSNVHHRPKRDIKSDRASERRFQLDKFESDFNNDPSYYTKKLQKVSGDFEVPKENRRNGNHEKYYNYCLLDLPKNRSLNDLNNKGFKEFTDHVFYVGKGEGNRAQHHGKKAAKLLANDPQSFFSGEKVKNPTVDKIHDIWRSGGSVGVLILDDHMLSEEAHTKEAAMIDALGKRRLKNINSGTYYGVASTMSASEQQQIGATVLMGAKNQLLRRGTFDIQDLPEPFAEPRFNVEMEDEFEKIHGLLKKLKDCKI